MTSTVESQDQTDALAERIKQAHVAGTPIAIAGSGSKRFLGEPVDTSTHDKLDMTAHRGIVSYEPGELVLTARAGTPLADIEAALADEGQRLAFEPPHYGAGATLGGTIAAGLSGPARPYAGAARDFVLGTRIINGQGEILRFGGEVMKNVAGYDLSRLMAGAHGTLGVLLEISLKVLPTPRTQPTRVFEHNAEQALAAFSSWAARPWPISATYWEAGRTYLRLSGATSSVDAAASALGGESVADDVDFWRGVREHERVFFTDGENALWRLSCAPAAPISDLPGSLALDWGGAQRWRVTDAPAEAVRDAARLHGGHATLYRGDARPRGQALAPALLAAHHRLKHAMDPAGILNPGRLIPEG